MGLCGQQDLCGDLERPGITWDFSLCSQELFVVPEIGQPHILKVSLIKLPAEHNETWDSNRDKRGHLIHLYPASFPKDSL